MFHSCFIQILIKLQKASQGREGGDLTNLSGSSQQIHLAPTSLPEGCWFLSSSRHFTRHIKMQNTQLFLSNSVLLDKLHWRSSLCQECKSRLGSRGGKAACASLFPMYSVLSAVMQAVSFQFRAGIIEGSVPPLPGFCSGPGIVLAVHLVWMMP